MRVKQKESAKPLSKQILVLGIGGAALLIVLVYQTFFSAPSFDDASAGAKTGATNRINAKDLAKLQPPPVRNADQSAQPQSAAFEQPALEFDSISWKRSGNGDADRNIFAYPPPPPPPPPPPAKEVTVPISSIAPNNVYARTPKEIELVVRGTNFTPEVRIYLNGTPTFGQTKFISAAELRAIVSRNYLAAPQQLRVEVKQPGREEEFFSNPISLNILDSPKPRFNMLGRISDRNDQNPQAILIEDDRQITVSIGEEFGEGKNSFAKPFKWKVIEINSAGIKVVDVSTALGVDHNVPMKDLPDKASAGVGTMTDFSASNVPTTEETPMPQVTYFDSVSPQTASDQQPGQQNSQQKPDENQQPTYVGRQGNQSDPTQFLKERQESIMLKRLEIQRMQQQQNPQQTNPNPIYAKPNTPKYGGRKN